ncbi:MAG TPA: transposase [Solirubrobacteraceae bacterium]|jgi:IS5 family transposase|nr:transposase [Solirubrobacteraceae bacterium]
MTAASVALRCAETISVILDSVEITDLIEQIEFLRWTGRPGYSTRTLMGVVLTKSLYAIPTWTRTLALVKDHVGLRAAIGCEKDQDVPSIDAVYRFTKKLCLYEGQRQECIDSVLQELNRKSPDLGKNIAIDASDIPAYAKDGSDPDASWGHRSAVSNRPSGTFLGYKLHMAVDTATELPLAWKIETARTHESKLVASLLDELHERGINPRTCAMDRGYDSAGVHFDCVMRGIDPVIPLRRTPDVKRGEDGPPDCEHGVWRFAGADRKRRAAKWRCPTGECEPTSIWLKANRLKPLIPRDTERWKKLYCKRGAVEREFGRLKNEWGLTPLRVRSIERVRLHADLTILTKLAYELVKARQSQESKRCLDIMPISGEVGFG